MERERNSRVAVRLATATVIALLMIFPAGCSDEPAGPSDPGRKPGMSFLPAPKATQLVYFHGATSEVVTPPAQHRRLGFTTSFPISDNRGDSKFCVSYSANVSGTANLAVDMGADITFSYDRADLLPGGNVPIQITYTPTNDAGPELSVDAAADVDMDVEIDDPCLAGLAALCVVDPLACVALAVAASIDAFEGQLDNFGLISAAGDFTAPLGADAPVVVSGTGNSAVLQFLGHSLLRATPVSSFTLTPTPPGALPGLGGGVALLAASGATLASPSPLIPVLEWQAPVALQATIALPATPGASATLGLSPILHWLNTTASLSIDLDLLGDLGDLFGDPSDIPIFSGNLGTTVGADAVICSGVPAPAQPACQATVAAGNLPYPALVPQAPGDLPAIPPLPAFAPAQLTIDLDADDDGLLDGEEFQIGSNPDDADTDDDGLQDGPEVKVHGCNPLVVDTDADDLTDAQEVNVHGTDCADPDTDDDELGDGLEVEVDTDPLDSDTDNDGIPDGQDVEWLQNVIAALGQVFGSTGTGLKTAMLSNLDAIESFVAQGKISHAIAKLEDLRSRVDGCGATADNGDWIVDCTAQLEVRALIDLFIANLSS
jgi:hypothetical protein